MDRILIGVFQPATLGSPLFSVFISGFLLFMERSKVSNFVNGNIAMFIAWLISCSKLISVNLVKGKPMKISVW